ncbi:hypothetical protein KDC22_24015 [Paenibacillus tritici]|uniref:hypothetical protein n=1 Tax=Paenibacillus tritici TaxID=1873425 RepID=UPI001BA8E16C|nr:hypothetical protein [Paenibacillus tritici]QUL53434.1 hypothetical protein KDC22_24015 [Paenibacillus tritici]
MKANFPWYRLRLLLIPLILFLLCCAPQKAHAGLWNSLKNGYHTITELPDEVNELKENYQSTMDKLEETRLMADNLQKQNSQLFAENEHQRQQLAEAMDSLHQVEEQKARRLNRIQVTVFTAAGLLLGYFFLIRIIRFILRRKSYK